MGETTGEIRSDIEQIRDRMEGTWDAIGYRMDIPARMSYRLSTTRESISRAVSGAAAGSDDRAADLTRSVQAGAASMLSSTEDRLEGVVDKAQERLSGMTDSLETGLSEIKESVVDTMTKEVANATATAKSQGRALGSFARDNALALGAGAFAAALAVGLLLPRTRIEQENLAPLTAGVAHRAVEAGEKALEKGEEMAQEAIKGMEGGERPQPPSPDAVPRPAGPEVGSVQAP